MENWIETNKNHNNLILSSRIRLARNINKIPFPYKLDDESGRKVIKMVEDAFYENLTNKNEFETKYLWEETFNTNCNFLERHIISKNLIDNRNKSAFIKNKNETVSIMINEEDHIRVQCITSGMNLEQSYNLCDKIDNLIEGKIQYSFDEKLGYLTTCPTNIGTGLRASVMAHLPMLTLNNRINGVLNAVAQVGMTIRGLYGEGSKANGNIYQISNQITLGVNEEEVINNLKAVVIQIINEERSLRKTIIEKHKYEIEDKVYRALGILRSAVLLNSNECLKFLSDVRLGTEMGIIKDVDSAQLNKLLVDTQPASMEKIYGEKLSDKEKNIFRAKLVRQRLK